MGRAGEVVWVGSAGWGRSDVRVRVGVCEDVQGGGARVDLRAGPGVEEVGEILASEKGRGGGSGLLGGARAVFRSPVPIPGRRRVGAQGAVPPWRGGEGRVCWVGRGRCFDPGAVPVASLPSLCALSLSR